MIELAFLNSPNKLLNAARSALVCINPPFLSGLNLPPPVIFAAMFFVINALSFAMSDASNLKIGLNVCGSNSTFLTMSFTINCASSFFNVLPFAFWTVSRFNFCFYWHDALTNFTLCSPVIK